MGYFFPLDALALRSAVPLVLSLQIKHWINCISVLGNALKWYHINMKSRNADRTAAYTSPQEIIYVVNEVDDASGKAICWVKAECNNTTGACVLAATIPDHERQINSHSSSSTLWLRHKRTALTSWHRRPSRIKARRRSTLDAAHGVWFSLYDRTVRELLHISVCFDLDANCHTALTDWTAKSAIVCLCIVQVSESPQFQP